MCTYNIDIIEMMQTKKSIVQIVWYTFFFLLISFLAFFPSWYRIQTALPGTVYMVENGLMADYYYYLSIIKQGRTEWNYINQYSTEPSFDDRSHIIFTVIGKIGAITGIGDISMYWISMVFLLLFTYIGSILLIRKVLPVSVQNLSLLFIFLTGPFPPYHLSLFGNTIYKGYEWWTQLNIYSRLTYAPHHFFGQMLIIWTTVCFLKFFSSKKMLWAIVCAICIMLINRVYAIPSFIWMAATGIFFLFLIIRVCINTKNKGLMNVLHTVKNWISPFFPGLLIIIGAFIGSYLYLSNIVITGKTASILVNWEYLLTHGEIYPNTISVFILSLGIIPLFVIPTCVSLMKRIRYDVLFLLCLFSTPFLLYSASVIGVLPINKFRFVHASIFVFGGICAAYGIHELIRYTKRSLAKYIIYTCSFCLLALSIATNVYYYWAIQTFQKPGYYNNLYISKSTIEAMDYLRFSTPPYSHVLSTFYQGMYIPVLTYNIVYVGHEVGTLDVSTKIYRSNHFFSLSMNQDQVRQLLTDGVIDYIFFEDTRELPQAYREFLTPVFTNTGTTIYKTVLN
jgi:hypothetical protein